MMPYDASPLRLGLRIVHGLSAPMHTAADDAGVPPFWWRVRAGSPLLETAGSHDVVLIDHDETALRLGWSDDERKATKASGALSFRFVDDAISGARGELPAHPKADAVGAMMDGRADHDFADSGEWAPGDISRALDAERLDDQDRK